MANNASTILMSSIPFFVLPIGIIGVYLLLLVARRHSPRPKFFLISALVSLGLFFTTILVGLLPQQPTNGHDPIGDASGFLLAFANSVFGLLLSVVLLLAHVVVGAVGDYRLCQRPRQRPAD